MSSKQVLDAGLVRRSTDTSSTANQLQEAATRAQQALSNAATEVSQVLGLDNLPAPETLVNNLHNQTLSFARTVGEFVGQLQNEVSSQTTLQHLLKLLQVKCERGVTIIINQTRSQYTTYWPCHISGSRWLPTASVRVRAQIGSCRICGVQCGTCQGSSPDRIV
jgi:hypothetical protein